MNRSLILAALVVLGLGGCDSKHELAKCKGPLIALNSDVWRPTPDELADLERLCPEDR